MNCNRAAAVFKTAARLFSAVTIIFFFCSTIAAAEKKYNDWSFSIIPLAGMHYGTLNEYVFEKDSNGNQQKLSELNWDIKPFWYMGASVTGSGRFISLSGYCSFAFSGRCGSMYDSDWLELNNLKNNYSISENILSKAYSLGGRIAAHWKPLRLFGFSLYTASDYEYGAFKAQNGYGWYGDSDRSATKKNVSYDSADAQYMASGSLLGINYFRETVTIWTGCTLLYTPFSHLSFELQFAAAPYTYVNSLDHHCGGYYYRDIMYGVFSSLQTGLTVSYICTQKISLSLAAKYTLINTLTGSDYISTSENGTYYYASEVLAGAGGNYADIQLALTYRPFQRK
jgi:hypothetical protein